MQVSTAFALSHGLHQIGMDTEGYDTGNMYIPGNATIVINKPGLYSVTGYLCTYGANDGVTELFVEVNGSVVLASADSATTDNDTHVVSQHMMLSQGDQLSLVYSLGGNNGLSCNWEGAPARRGSRRR